MAEPKIPFWQSNTIRYLAGVIVAQVLVLAVAFAAGQEISLPYLVGTFVVPVLGAVLRMLNAGTAGDSPAVSPPTP